MIYIGFFMLVDSHCHLDRVDLTPFNDSFDTFVQAMRESGITHSLCVSIDLEAYPSMLKLVESYDDISTSVGVHPCHQDGHEPDVDELIELASHKKNVAIGETGLDYFRTEGDMTWQQDRFRVHIAAAIATQKPLIIHTRQAREDTIRIMQEEDAGQARGVMHCFTETWEMASAALDMGFYISISGIVNFKNAQELRDVVKKVPLDRLLIETDSPYLAPVPHRGKSNNPIYIDFVAQQVADLKGLSKQDLIKQTHDNFYTLFNQAKGS